MNNEELKMFGWDDEISNEGTPFITFPPGKYPFVVTGFERSTYQPRPGYAHKVPVGCLMATLSLEFTNPNTNEKTTVKENLYLYEKGEWRISEFFVAIGQKKKGEPVRPNWGAILGAHGVAELEINKYTDKDKNERENNKVKSFEEPETPNYQAPAAGYQAQQSYQQPVNNQQAQQPPVQNPAPQQNVTPFPQQQNAAPQNGTGYNF